MHLVPPVGIIVNSPMVFMANVVYLTVLGSVEFSVISACVRVVVVTWWPSGVGIISVIVSLVCHAGVTS